MILTLYFFIIKKSDVKLVAGDGFEPSTSRLWALRPVPYCVPHSNNNHIFLSFLTQLLVQNHNILENPLSTDVIWTSGMSLKKIFESDVRNAACTSLFRRKKDSHLVRSLRSLTSDSGPFWDYFFDKVKRTYPGSVRRDL